MLGGALGQISSLDILVICSFPTTTLRPVLHGLLRQQPAQGGPKSIRSLSSGPRIQPLRAVPYGLLEERGGQVEKLYLNVEEAASYVGIGVNTMRDFVNSKDPPPFMKVGKKVLLQKAALAPYFERKQEVKL